MKKLCLLVLLALFFACSSDEPDCALDHSFSGQTFEALWLEQQDGMQQTEHYIFETGFTDRVMAPPLCDSLTFQSIRQFSFQARLDSAYFDHCRECLEVLEWSGPGCPLAFDSSDEEASFLDLTWQIAQMEIDDMVLYPPCGHSMTARFNSDGTSVFLISRRYEMSYSFDGVKLQFMLPGLGIGIGQDGYLAFYDAILEQQLYTFGPLQVLLEDNRLTLSRENPPFEILLIR